MRRCLIVCGVFVGLMWAPSAFAATTRTVWITSAGFSPRTAGITADDTIRWKNTDTRYHQVVSTRGTFASPVLAPGKSYTFPRSRKPGGTTTGTRSTHAGPEA